MRDQRLQTLLETATSYHQNHSPSKKQSLETPFLVSLDARDDDDESRDNEASGGDLRADDLGVILESSNESPPSPIVGERKKKTRRRLSYSPEPGPSHGDHQVIAPNVIKKTRPTKLVATDGSELRFYKKNDV